MYSDNILRFVFKVVSRKLTASNLSRTSLPRPGREADHSPSASAEVKKMWIYTPTLPYVFMV
jgi:hypothetical protein